MNVGDLVKYKHFPDESAVVIKVHPTATGGVHAIEVLSNLGVVAVLLDPHALEEINESR